MDSAAWASIETSGTVDAGSWQPVGAMGLLGQAPMVFGQSVLGLAFVRAKLERYSIHAVAEPRGRRTVRKHMTQVTTAPCAVHLSPCHEQASVNRRLHRVVERLPETWPTRTALVFGFRIE